MPKITNFTTKAARTRQRVKNLRQRKKNREIHERKVQLCIQKINSREHSLSSTSVTRDSDESLHLNESLTEENQWDLEEELRVWSDKHRITLSAIGDLLSMLNLAGFTFLPKDARTLKRTPTNVEIHEMGTGKFWYYGIHKCLERVLHNCNSHLKIHLDFNFDGMPLFNSSKMGFWPILSSIQGNGYCYIFVWIFLYRTLYSFLDRISTHTSNGHWHMVW